MQNKQDECGDVGRGGTMTTITLQQTTYQLHQKATIHNVPNTILYTTIIHIDKNTMHNHKTE